MTYRTCPHCGHEHIWLLSEGGHPRTLDLCGACGEYFLPAEEILKKKFAETSAGERIRVATEIAGLKDTGYQTVAHGYVQRFEGRGRVEFADGIYEAIGYGPEGDAWFVYRQGGIRWKKVE